MPIRSSADVVIRMDDPNGVLRELNGKNRLVSITGLSEHDGTEQYIPLGGGDTEELYTAVRTFTDVIVTVLFNDGANPEDVLNVFRKEAGISPDTPSRTLQIEFGPGQMWDLEVRIKRRRPFIVAKKLTKYIVTCGYAGRFNRTGLV